MISSRIQPVTPLMKMALNSFGRARTALVRGHVDEMIGQLTQGVTLLDAIEAQTESPRRRSGKSRAS